MEVENGGGYYGGSGEDRIFGINFNPNDNRIYFCGRTSSDNNIATGGTHQPSRNGNFDAFLVRITKSGNRDWGTYFGGSDNENEKNYLYQDIGFSGSNVHIIGSTKSNNNISTPDAYQTSRDGDFDGYWAIFNGANGTRLYSTYYGGGNKDYFHSIIVDNCQVYLGGIAESNANIASMGSYDQTLNGPGDAFLVNFKMDEMNISFSSTCVGGTIIFNLSGSSNYRWFTQPTGGTPFHTGTSYTTPALSKTQVYYVEAINYGCTSQTRTPIYAYVNNPVSTITGTNTLCYNQSTTLNAAARVTVWQEDFNDLERVHTSWILNEYGRRYLLSSTPTITNFSPPTTNKWVINEKFTPYSPSSDGGNYLHIAENDELTMQTSMARGQRNLTAVMNYTIPGSLLISTSAQLEFSFIGQGSTNSYIKIIYSVNGGAWQEHTTNYGGYGSWANLTLSLSSLSGWSAGASLRLGFRFFDSVSETSTNPAFGIDNLRITVIPDNYTWYDGPTVVGSGFSYITPNLTTDKNYGLEVTACGCTGVLNTRSVSVGYNPPTTTFSGSVCYNQSATIPVSTPNKIHRIYDFAQGLSGWTIESGDVLIPSSTPSNGTQPNRWVVNTDYTPFFVSSQGGNYLHITTLGKTDMSYNNGSNNSTNTAIRLTSNLTGLLAPDFQLRFDWIGEGASDAYAKLIYRIGSFGTWQEYPLEFNNSNVWQTFTINLTSLGWTPGAQFNFGFRWRNESNAGPSSFGVDNIQLIILDHPYRWYTVPTGGTPIFTGSTYNTPPLTSSITYYVEAGSTALSCVSQRTPINVTVNDPKPIVNTEWVVCSGNSTNINITGPSGGTFDWYTTPTGGTKFHTGSNYSTPPITTETDYYIETIYFGCTSSTREKVTVYVNEDIVPETDADDYYICTGNQTTLNCTFPTTTTIHWYDAPSGGTLLGTGSTFITPVLTTTTNFYVESYILGCPSTRKEVTVNVYNPLPPAPTLSGPSTKCEGQTAVINATAPPGVQFDWYTVPTGGTKFHTGNSYTTPPLTPGTHDFYVESIITGCTSSRTLHSINVNPIPPTPSASQVITVCPGNDADVQITHPIGSYTYYIYNSSTGFSLSTSSTNIQLPTENILTTYEIYAIQSSCTSNVFLLDITPLYEKPIVVPSATEICPGQIIDFEVSNPTQSGVSGNWVISGYGYTIINQTSSTLTVQFNLDGPYDISIEGGCEYSDDVEILVLPEPNPTANDVTICEGQSANLIANFNPDIQEYYWYDAGNNLVWIGNTYITPILTSTTTYYLSAVSYDGCTGGYYPVTVNVVPYFTITGPGFSYQNAVEKYTLSQTIWGAIWYVDDWSAVSGIHGYDDYAIVQFAPDFTGSVTLYAYDNTLTCYNQMVINVLPTVKAKVQVALQGAKSPMNNGTMQTHTNHYDHLEDVYEATGNLTLSPYPFISSIVGGKLKEGINVPLNAIDVVQVELRDPSNLNSVISTTYGWLLDNGLIVDYACGNGEISGSILPYINFKNITMPLSSYVIVVKHRNHLPVRTATSYSLNSSVPTSTIDLRDENVVYHSSGNFVYKDINNNCYMFMGNVYDHLPNNDIGEVNASDFFFVSSQNDLNLDGYYLGDLNLDGEVDADDFNLIQVGNDGLYFMDIPKPYLDTTW